MWPSECVRSLPCARVADEVRRTKGPHGPPLAMGDPACDGASYEARAEHDGRMRPWPHVCPHKEVSVVAPRRAFGVLTAAKLRQGVGVRDESHWSEVVGLRQSLVAAVAPGLNFGHSAGAP